MEFQNHTNSRPIIQPIRVKELLRFYESDDDESEDRTQDSDTESDSDDPQPLLFDDYGEDDSDKSLFTHTATRDSETIETHEIPRGIISADSEKSSPISNSDTESHGKPEGKSSVFYKQKQEHVHNAQNEKKLKYNECNQVQLNVEAHTQDRLCQIEQRSNGISNLRPPNQDHLCKPDVQPEQKSSCKLSSTNEPPVVSACQHFKSSLQQLGVHNLQNANVKVETADSKSTSNKDTAPHYKINRSLSLDAKAFITSEQWALQTPLKHPPANPTHPDPCFSRRNINQTPQNKIISDISKSHGVTLASNTPHWSQNTLKQTPLQNKSISFKDSLHTPKNAVYFTPSIGRYETPRYLNTEGKIRKPLTDAGCLPQTDACNRHLLQESQLAKVNKGTPKVPNNNPLCKSLPKQIVEKSGNFEHPEADVNEESTENKFPSKESGGNAILDKEPISKISNSAHPVHCTKDSIEALKAACNQPQNRHSSAGTQSQQQHDVKETVDNVSNVQFSVRSNVATSRQTKTVFVKGKEYLILGTLGQGMSGEVLRVQDLSSLELCAIKCVNLSRMDKDSAQGCLEEISMLHKLQAPCIVKMFDYEIKYPMVYVVMEMGDTDLSRLLKTTLQEKQIPLTMILYYWTEMLRAVKHIHDNGVIHSDLKPANFLLVRGRLKLIDFGIASSMNADMTSVVKNCPIGTLNYISPEALMDTGGSSNSPTHNVKYKISFKSDVWSLGCILYSLVYGHTPFHHIRSQWAKINAITNPKVNISFPATLPSEDRNKVTPSPPILIDVMRKCLQHNPKARPTVAELLQVEYVPTTQGHVSATLPEIPANILLKLKRSLSDDEWRQLTSILENRRYT